MDSTVVTDLKHTYCKQILESSDNYMFEHERPKECEGDGDSTRG